MEMTVSSIVQGLLEKGHITAEEALVLLKAELNKTCCSVAPITPYNRPRPYNPPFQPYQPQIWYSSGTSNTGHIGTSNDNITSK